MPGKGDRTVCAGCGRDIEFVPEFMIEEFATFGWTQDPTPAGHNVCDNYTGPPIRGWWDEQASGPHVPVPVPAAASLLETLADLGVFKRNRVGEVVL